MKTFCALLITIGTGWGLVQATAKAQGDECLRGAIDVHCHTAPDALARSVDDVALARLAKAAGMRAFIVALRDAGIADAEIDLMAKRNPARLLGLPVEEEPAL